MSDEGRPKVVSLRGVEVVPPGAPNPRVVALAEELLNRARSGDLMGLAVSLYHADDTHSRRCAGPAVMATIGNIERLKNYLCHWMDDDQSREPS